VLLFGEMCFKSREWWPNSGWETDAIEANTTT
jgi:hypothetical protein